MKFASLPNGTRDGALHLVSTDLTLALNAQHVAPTLQAALDHWDTLEARLRELSTILNQDRAQDAFPFQPAKALAPLPRAHARLEARAYPRHVELVTLSLGGVPPSPERAPTMYQGCSDPFLPPCAPIAQPGEDLGIDFGAEVGAILSDVAQGASEADCARSIRLLCLLNNVTLRSLEQDDLGHPSGVRVSKPPCAMSPVVVTPDELGSHWRDGRVHLPLVTTHNGKKLGDPNAGAEMAFGFVQLAAHAAQRRPLGPGTVLGGGTVSVADRARGSSCLAEKRMLEKQDTGEMKTPFMRVGDTVRMEMLLDGRSVFGALEQGVTVFSARK
jgi:fumarylacetoacetate (FAA) hydrolase